MEQRLNDAFVNAGCLLFFAEQAATSRQNDILDSLLYVQLAASKKHPRFTGFKRWKETWLAAALRFGWVLGANEHFSEPASKAGTDTVWGICARALNTLVDDAVVCEARSLAGRDTQSEGSSLLASQALYVHAADGEPTQTTVVLQAGFVDSNGRLALAVIMLSTTQSLASDFLFEPLQSGHLVGNVEVTVYSMRLMENVYVQFRSAFDTALADRRAALVGRLC